MGPLNKIIVIECCVKVKKGVFQFLNNAQVCLFVLFFFFR